MQRASTAEIVARADSPQGSGDGGGGGGGVVVGVWMGARTGIRVERHVQISRPDALAIAVSLRHP